MSVDDARAQLHLALARVNRPGNAAATLILLLDIDKRLAVLAYEVQRLARRLDAIEGREDLARWEDNGGH